MMSSVAITPRWANWLEEPATADVIEYRRAGA